MGAAGRAYQGCTDPEGRGGWEWCLCDYWEGFVSFRRGRLEGVEVLRCDASEGE